jgi:ATP-dependent Clp protease ATP-binding subunit ClpA
MALAFLSPEAQSALDLAKRAVDDTGVLTVGLLLAAAYNVGDMHDELPELATHLSPPRVQRRRIPDAVEVAPDLQPILQQLSREDEVTVDEMAAALLGSPPGRAHLAAAGLTEAEIEHARAVLMGEAVPETVHQGAGEVDDAWRTSTERKELFDGLASFGRVLTDGSLQRSSIVEMDTLLRRLQKTLVKMKRRNVIVTGHPGTGKTAVVYEFARRLAEGHPSIVPMLRDRDIFELSPSFLRAGAGVVGAYDERVSTLIKLLEAHPKVILFVDEIHSLLQSGMHERGPFTEANEAFKQALGRGSISIIGATTTAEYRHYIAPDQALQRRFGLLKVDPPSHDATIKILEARIPRLEAHYAPITIPHPVLVKAVELTDEHLPTRYQPDKAIQLLDEALALRTVQPSDDTTLTEDALLEALEDTIGHGLVRPEALTIETVLDHLKAKIVGQDDALEQIAKTFVAGLATGWSSKTKPQGIYFFCGPTGVGKTETAKQLSTLLGGGREALLRIDCNTLAGRGMDAKGVIANQLLGVPRGYVGYSRGEGGLLSKIRDQPECIVLFDEIEKAPPDITDLLLQILDEGRVHDTDENLLDFRRAFLVFTTNAGTTYEGRSGPIGFQRPGGVVTEDAAGAGTPSVTKQDVLDDLRQRGYREEFLGRNIDFVVFKALGRDAIRQVMERQLAALAQTAELQGYRFEHDDAIIEHLVRQWQPRFGVRHLTSILRNRIVEQLAIGEVQGELVGVTTIRLAIDDTGNVGELASRRRDGATMTISIA